MNRGKAISLSSLTQSHRDEIDQMVAAIRGNPGSTLWTSKMRATVRGGKVLGQPRIQEWLDSDDKS